MTAPIFPDRLLDWAGHRAGGVRKLFHDQSSRPSGGVIRTGLLERLEAWVSNLIGGNAESPRVILLVGGPGNGKTEAIEACIRRMDEEARLDGKLVHSIARQFSAGAGQAVPRLASSRITNLPNGQPGFELAIVQDASTSGDISGPENAPHRVLLAELEKYAVAPAGTVYLACVNRGVLDDAFSSSIDENREAVRTLLAQVIRSVGMAWNAPSCWPLDGFQHVAVWPMDVESLLVPMAGTDEPPARRLLDIATNASDWPVAGGCPAGDRCPHCTSRAWLDDERRRVGLLKLLRWYELASGKRWSFRDLGSLLSFLLADARVALGSAGSPCEAAARLRELDETTAIRRSALALQAPYLLVAGHYAHALFGKWAHHPARTLRKDLRELDLENNRQRKPTSCAARSLLMSIALPVTTRHIRWQRTLRAKISCRLACERWGDGLSRRASRR